MQTKVHQFETLSPEQLKSLVQRPKQDFKQIFATVQPIIDDIQARGDAALREYTLKFDKVDIGTTPVIKLPLPPNQRESLSVDTMSAIDMAFSNIRKFHEKQLKDATAKFELESQPGVHLSRVARPIERVGLYVPGGSAVLPSTALMLSIPAMLAGCSKIVIATPPRPDGSICPEVLYVAEKVQALAESSSVSILKAGGAQAIAALAFGTESVDKVDKICGPGNQYVTAAKMLLQNSDCCVSIDMPAGPSEVLVVCDSSATPAFVAADLLSQAEHGVDSQVMLVTVGADIIPGILSEIDSQLATLPRAHIATQALSKSHIIMTNSIENSIAFSNLYAPEHLILQVDNAAALVPLVQSAGSVFVGHWTPESCGDYSSGTNHTLPTYGYARMYSGVSTLTFLKFITVQEISHNGLKRLSHSVTTLAAVEQLEAHRRAVVIRLEHKNKKAKPEKGDEEKKEKKVVRARATAEPSSGEPQKPEPAAEVAPKVEEKAAPAEKVKPAPKEKAKPAPKEAAKPEAAAKAEAAKPAAKAEAEKPAAKAEAPKKKAETSKAQPEAPKAARPSPKRAAPQPASDAAVAPPAKRSRTEAAAPAPAPAPAPAAAPAAGQKRKRN
eukprot:TRINITY_DN1475_c0_g1_i9.p1 TRINITY_DN1475_c0_g1~~TRINITY_DN1475_c0_g1_i9.p1  ORF type:complete len:619 (-),score=182.36 TRINITY_DN1475_c0_g1_i9:13-1848(-)